MHSLSQNVTLSSEVVFQELKGEAVLLDLSKEMYFGLDEVGTMLWQHLEQDPSLRAAYSAVLAEFDVGPAQLEQDVLAFIERLSEAGLVTAEQNVGETQDADMPEATGDQSAK